MSVGRPRSFDKDQALDRALRVFWRKGFEGTSLRDLTEAMGINRPSLYSAFGDKESLFHQALARYVEAHACYITPALEEPTARAVAEKVWAGCINVIRNPRNPKGCFLVQGALACGDMAKDIQQAMAKQRRKGEAALKDRFERAESEGELPSGIDAVNLASYVATVSYGLAVQAAGGASASALEATASVAARSLPSADNC